MGLPFPHYEELERVRPLSTIGLVVANVLVYLATSAGNGFLQIEDRWVQALAFVPAHILKPDQLYRVFTSMFIHANLAHIFFNMLFLYNFGRQVEAVIGSKRFLALYFFSGIFATVFHTAFIPIEGVSSAFVPALGASGAISGVLGAYLLLFPGTKLTMCFFYFFLPLCATMRAAAYLVFWFALQVIQGYLGASLGVAVFAHAGGFIAGVAALPLFLDYERLSMLKLYASMRGFFFNVFFTKPGLGTATKALLVLLIGLTAAGAAYSAYVGPNIGVVSKILDFRVATYNAGGLVGYENESVILQLSSEGLSYTPISASSVRVVFNRLYAAGLIYNKAGKGELVTINSSSTRRVQGVPVRIVINATLEYDEYGLLGAGGGRIGTDVVSCNPYTGVCARGDFVTYSFEVSTVQSMRGLEGIPVSELAVLSLAASAAAIVVIGRAEKFEVIA